MDAVKQLKTNKLSAKLPWSYSHSSWCWQSPMFPISDPVMHEMTIMNSKLTDWFCTIS